MILPKKDLTDIEKELIHLKLEKAKLNRERSRIVLTMSIFLYFCFLLLGIFGFIGEYITRGLLNVLVLIGVFVLIIGTWPYIKTMRAEDKAITETMNKLKKRR